MGAIAYIDNDGTPVYYGDAPAKNTNDYSAYAPFLNYAIQRTNAATTGALGDTPDINNQTGLDELFGSQYLGRGANINPYGSVKNRDAMRGVAAKLGLSQADADRAALDYANTHYNQFGQAYSEGTHPGIVADEVAKRLFAQAGKPYQGLSTEQTGDLVNKATKYEQDLNDYDDHSWQRDDFGGMFALWGEQLQSAWEGGSNDGLPSEQGLAGADNPLNTALWNKVLNKDWDPYGNEYGLPTKQNYEQASHQGIETGAAGVLQWAAQQAAGAMLAGSGGIGGLAGEAGASAEAVSAAQTAKAAADAYKQYQNYQNGGDIDPMWAAGTASSGLNNFSGGGGGGGDLSGSPDAGTLTGTAPDAGTTGGSMWDEDGNWIDGGDDYQDPNADAYNDPFYDGSGYDTTGMGPDSGNWWDSITNAGSSGLSYLQNLLKGVGGGGTAVSTAAGGLNLAKILGSLGSAGLGATGSKNLSNKYDAMSKRYEGFGQDYRDRLAATYKDPNAWLNSAEVQAPVQQGTNALARSLSIKGNPAGSPAAMGEIENFASNQLFGKLGQERDRLANFGGLNTFSAAAPGAASKAADAGAGVYNAAGSGLADLTNPQPSLMDFLKQLKAQGFA